MKYKVKVKIIILAMVFGINRHSSSNVDFEYLTDW